MKRWIAVAAISLFAAGSMAQGIAEGTKELGLSGVLDFDTGVGSLFDLSVSYGYFLMDGLEVGGYADYARDDFITGGGLGAFAELNRQLQNSPLVPFVGTSVGFELIEVDTGFNSDSENAVEFGLSLGFKYFLSSAVAIDSRYQFQAATADIYPEEDGLGGIDHKLVFGIRAFFK